MDEELSFNRQTEREGTRYHHSCSSVLSKDDLSNSVLVVEDDEGDGITEPLA